MDLDKMIHALKAERDAIDAAIAVLERIAFTHRKRRGRPPAWMQVRREAARQDQLQRPAKRTRSMSEETKKKMAEAQRKRWEAYRKAKTA